MCDDGRSCPEEKKPGECSPEQIRKCHGEVSEHPCEPPRPVCRKPENLKGKPGDCTPEQIRICHGDDPDHPCVPEKKDD